MTAPLKNRRRSSLSAAFDHFRNKCRKTRIDSLLSPPKLDSGTSNEDLDLSPSDEEGVPLTSGSSGQSPGHTEDKDEDEEEERNKYDGRKGKEADEQSRCDSKLPNFIFDSDGFDGFGSLDFSSPSTSSDEDKRLLSALADFSAEVTEAEDFGRYFSLSHHSTKGKEREEQQAVSPIESVSTGVVDRSVSATSFTHLLHSDHSGSTLDFEVGVPLQRVVAKGNTEKEWTTQVQTEPQTQEQSLAQSTYASLDQVVEKTVLINEEDQAEESQRERERAVPVMRTVDGVRLDARPLIRHSGVSAPAHSSLQLHETATSTLHTTTETGEASTHRPHLASRFSSCSNSSAESMQLDLPPYRRRYNIPPRQLSTTALRTKRHQTTWDTTRPKLPSYPPHVSSITSAPRDTRSDLRRISNSPPPTLPVPPGPPARKPYTALSTASAVSSFHYTLNEKLNTAISTGAVKASQIGVKERVRRLSGAKNLQHGWEVSARRMSGWGRGIGEAVIASGGVGVGWGEGRHRDDGEVGRRSAGVYYGGGFI
ncbi:hypothetical protein M436DRAFT_79539 [Aureobasidium namibiae CBS 147.97]|uniref:Uncharacterized protein n=1 Tax=Aureobasidium namibiae CBS 147.97 TaxID=1043004 RepID=A0A074WSW7_9PEZI